MANQWTPADYEAASKDLIAALKLNTAALVKFDPDTADGQARGRAATPTPRAEYRQDRKRAAVDARVLSDKLSEVLGLSDASAGSFGKTFGKFVDGMQAATRAAAPFSDQYLKVINQFGGGFEDYANLANKSAQTTADITERMINQ